MAIGSTLDIIKGKLHIMNSKFTKKYNLSSNLCPTNTVTMNTMLHIMNSTLLTKNCIQLFYSNVIKTKF